MKKLIKKILKEEFDSEDFGWAEETEFTPAQQFIYEKFKECKLEPMQSKNWEGWTKYIDKSGKILFADNIGTGNEDTFLYFDYDKIYEKLVEMGLSYSEMKNLCIDMLYDTHKRKVLTALTAVHF